MIKSNIKENTIVLDGTIRDIIREAGVILHHVLLVASDNSIAKEDAIKMIFDITEACRDTNTKDNK